MKKLLALFLTLIVCYGVFASCNNEEQSESSSSEEEVELVFFEYEQLNYEFELTEEESRRVIEIMDARDFHVEDLCDCYVPYKFYFGEKRIRYHENILEDLDTWRVKKLSDEEKEFLDGIARKYIGIDYEEENRVHIK